MASLISDAQFQQIRDALRDVTDTFLRLPITYEQHVGSTDILQEGNSSVGDAPKTHELEALLLPAQVGEKSETDRTRAGSLDLSETDVYLSYDVLNEKGLINDDKQFIGQVDKDYIVSEGLRYRVLAINKDGQLKDTSVLVRLRVTLEEDQNG